ncbi:hypothetical protein D3C87_1463500 [compost metagenome]
MRAARVRDGQHRHLRAGQRRADGLHMGVGDGRRLQPDAQHAVVRVMGDDRRAADAVDLHAARAADQLHGGGQRRHVQHRFGLLQGLDIAVENLADDLRWRVLRGQVFMDVLHRLHDLLRQRDLQLLEAGGAQQLAEAHHAAVAGLGALGDLADRHVDHFRRMAYDEFADALRGRAHRRQQALDTRQHGLRRAPLRFGGGGRRLGWAFGCGHGGSMEQEADMTATIPYLLPSDGGTCYQPPMTDSLPRVQGRQS